MLKQFWALKRACVIVSYTTICKRNCMTNVLKKEVKKLHPYKCIHPWKSLTEFSEDLLNSVSHNKDGVVVLNKPYGIARERYDDNKYNAVANGVDYSLNDALPFIAEELNYKKLVIVKSPEKYMSGVTILADNLDIVNAVQNAYIRSQYKASTFWMITTGIPQSVPSKSKLALKFIMRPGYDSQKAVLVSSWTKNDHKYKRLKLVQVEYQVLSKSIRNLCSLIEVKLSHLKSHTLRLFASTILYSPILGDNVCACRIQKVGNAYVTIDPFLANVKPPVLNKDLFYLLNVKPTEQQIIPVHAHLKSMTLPKFFGKDITFEAPLPPAFAWTCKQLEF